MVNSNLWPVGVIIYISGTVFESWGANLQRYSINKELKKEEDIREKKTKQYLWRWGMFLFIGSNLFMSSAMFFCSQTLL